MTITETQPTSGSTGADGRVVGIAGPVIDVEFQRGFLPELESALSVRDHRRRHAGAGARRGRPAAR